MGEEMRLVHFSSEPLLSARSVDQSDEKRFWRGKPSGLWLSVEGGGDGWSDWCLAEGFRDVHNQNAYEIALAKNANVLRIKGPSSLRLFHNEYANEHTLSPTSNYRKNLIDWERVAKKYSGIIIAPYQWTHRLDGPVSDWYYGWDCASGCIWDAGAIESVTQIDAAQFSPPKETADMWIDEGASQ